MANSRASILPDAAVSDLLQRHYGLTGRLGPLAGYCDQNVLLTSESGERHVAKITRGGESLRGVIAQNAAMSLSLAAGLPVPGAIANSDGKDLTRFNHDGSTYLLRVLTYLPGTVYADVPKNRQAPALWENLGGLLGKLDRTLQEFPLPEVGHSQQWDLAHGHIVCQNALQLLDDTQRQIVDGFLERYRQHVLPSLGELPRSVIHSDANDYNVLVDNAENPTTIVGLIDFGDLMLTHTVNELAIAAAYALMGQSDPVATLTHLTAAYHRQRALNEAEVSSLFGLVGLRLCTSVCNAAAQLQERPDNEYLQVSAKPAIELLARLREESPYAVECELRRSCSMPTDRGRLKDAIIDAREQHLSKAYSLSFREPLKIVRGEGAYLFDENGRKYLDMVNNVCHVGHCHPRVVAAGQAQMARLNTNTRFLHDNIVDYAEQLLATLPDELSVCMFVNSGSEANELAFRLARTYTESRELLVVDGAYHGNTTACVDASPYKFDGPGGSGAPDHVHKVILPDPYKGQFEGMGPDAAAGYALDVERALGVLVDKGRIPGAFICESLQGVAGQIIMPDGYLEVVYPMVRNAGGVCIADEVQVGFGRVGSHMWAFETQGVVPDILTLGKPIGNGHPMAAVVTTNEIADAFVTGMEYFNTFGGNPVSCAIGRAVLDVIHDEGLQENAHRTGAYLLDRLRDLQRDFELIGDVRGLGLFIGVELVTDQESKTPATEQAAALIENLKERGVILSTEGPGHNVLKIKPPIVFNRGDADFFVDALRDSL